MVALGPGYSSAGASRLRGELGTASPSLGQLATQSVGRSTPQISSPLAAPASQAQSGGGIPQSALASPEAYSAWQMSPQGQQWQAAAAAEAPPLSPAMAVMQSAQSMGFLNGQLPWGGTDPTTGVNLRQDIVGNAYNNYVASLQNYAADANFNIDPGAGNAGGIAATSPGIGIGESGVGISEGFGGPAISGYGYGTVGAPTTAAIPGALGPGDVGYGGPTSGVPGFGYGGLGTSNVSGITGALEGTAALSGYGVPAGLAGTPSQGPSSPGYGSPSSPGVPGDTGFGDAAGFGSASAFGGPTGLGIGNPGEAGIGFGSSIGSVGMGGYGGFGDATGFGDAAGIGSGIGDGSGGGGGGGGGK